MRAIFICGTDTGVGKTIVTGLLLKEFREKGIKAISQKWVQTGCAGFPSDIEQHLKIAGISKKEIKDDLSLINPYCLKFPSSPHLAAKLEKKRLDVKVIKDSFNKLSKKYDYVIVEGVGGTLVPFDDKTLIIDIVKELKLPVLIVADNKLGAINHTLLTIESLKKRGLKIVGIIFNNTEKANDKRINRDNPKIIQKLSGVKVLNVLPYSKKINSLKFKTDEKPIYSLFCGTCE